MADRHVDLPALIGLDPLGFLAALGVLRLIGRERAEVRLSFDPVTATARLNGVDDIEQIVDQLGALFDAMPPGGLMIGLPPALPPSKAGPSGSDPGRIEPHEFSATARAATDAAAREWIRALWTELAVDDKGRCALTPFSAPSGQQTLRSMFEKPTESVRTDPAGRFREALASWQRVDGFTAENLDFRAVRGAADQQDGRATMSGVPGATWLALSAIPLFAMGGDGVAARTLRWANLRYPDRSRLSLSWPVWDRPLDLDAVRALLAHRAIDRGAEHAAARSAASHATDVRQQLQALGVQRVVVAHRRQLPGGKSAGVLVAAGSWA
ncbi:MAG: type I-G CRISPR-associated protein, Cas3-extension family [Acidimicrobiales bacterium]